MMIHTTQKAVQTIFTLSTGTKIKPHLLPRGQQYINHPSMAEFSVTLEATGLLLNSPFTRSNRSGSTQGGKEPV